MFGIWPSRSDFIKPCPVCAELVSIRNLRKVPASTCPRWYQLTPAPRTGCPYCGELVTFSLANSPVIVVPFALLGVLIFSEILLPQVHAAFESVRWLKFGAELLVLLVSAAVMTAGVRRARLVRDAES